VATPSHDADHARQIGAFIGNGSGAAQEHVLAHRQRQATGERLRRAIAQSQAEVPHEPLQCRGPPGMRPCYRRTEPLREDFRPTVGVRQRKRRTDSMILTSRPLGGRIGQLPVISGVLATGGLAVSRTG
jgi:hypothetical protein